MRYNWLRMHFCPDIVLHSNGKHEFRVKNYFVHVRYNEELSSAFNILKGEAFEMLRIRGVAMWNVCDWIIGQEN